LTVSTSYSSAPPPYLHSFPTRRSSDLPQNWGEATVKTLINRLLKKKAIASERTGGRARYRPLVSREDYVTGESQGLLDRLFGGEDRKSTRLNSSHDQISYAVFCLKKKN